MDTDHGFSGLRFRRFQTRRVAGLSRAPLARAIVCLMLLALVVACAGSAVTPTAVLDLPASQKAALRLGDITAQAGPGVAITPDDLHRITELVTAEIHASSPATLAPAGAAGVTLMRITITRYDEGSSFARFMLAGLGQTYIEGDVELLDGQTKQEVAGYKVSKDFAFGGIYGGVTTIRDVEKGFARSVAATVTQKA